jgi:flagellar FliL protein
MAEEKDVMENVDEEKPPKKSFVKFIVLGAIVIILGVGGYMGWRLYGKGETEGGKEKPPVEESSNKKKEVAAKINCPLETFIVNLMDKSGLGKRYLKVDIMLEVGSEEAKSMVGSFKPQLRDAILLLLSSQSFNEINTIDGKLGLKQELLMRVNQVFGKSIVQRIYFTEFVVQ